MFRVMGSMMPYRNKAYDIYRRNFSEASAVGFLSAILFTIFAEPVKSLVDFGEKWMELSGLPYQMNIAMLGFIVGYGTVKVFLLMRMQIFKILLSYQGWMTQPKSTTTKMWALMLGLLKGNGKYPCFYFESLLPRLPVPDLNATLDRFLLSMRCLLPDKDYIELFTATECFREKEGPMLNKYLLQRYQTRRNWVSDIWVDMAYLGYREPCAVNVNCYALDRRTAPTTDQLARAANLIYNIVRFYDMLSTETLTPQYMNDMLPISMEGYKHMNCSVRIPRLGKDELKTYTDVKHVVIFRKGVYFKLTVFKVDSDGYQVQVSVPEIYAQLHQLVSQADESKDYCPVAVFTSQNRDYWAKVRERLVAIETNQESIEVIDSSIGVFVLEEESPKTLEEEAIFTMTGHGTNRYFDKALQYVVYSNGRIGVNAEHSSGDATLPGRIWEYVLSMEKRMYDEDGGLMKISEKQLSKLTLPLKLEWQLADFEMEITESLDAFRKLADTFDLNIVMSEYGKGYIKKKKMSPDGYLQMAIQLAYYKLTGKCVRTYESASTRLFAEGRTETIRPVTDYSVQWCKAMVDLPTSRDQRILLLKKAVNAQTRLKNEAVLAQAWDRHMFGLFAVSKELGIPTPKLFCDKNFLMPDLLSTSQTPTKFTDLWSLETSCLGGGFSPTNKLGYGISYIIVGEDLFVFHVSSNYLTTTTSSRKMADKILDSLAEMKTLLD